MRMDNQECLVLLRGQKPLRLYKIIPDEHPSFGRLRDVRVSDYMPHWRQGEETPKAKPAPSPKPSCEQEEVSPPSSSADPSPPPQDDAAPPSSDATPPPDPPSGWGPKYDYGLLDPVDGFYGAGQEPDSGWDVRYGGFDPIEAPPQDVGGEH